MSKELAMMLVVEHEEEFKPGFKGWLDMNFHVYEIFERLALKIANKRDRYSARTIIEHMRFEDDVREMPTSDHAFKLNNNSVPDMSRMFILRNPKHSELFETRISPLRARLGHGHEPGGAPMPPHTPESGGAPYSAACAGAARLMGVSKSKKPAGELTVKDVGEMVVRALDGASARDPVPCKKLYKLAPEWVVRAALDDLVSRKAVSTFMCLKSGVREDFYWLAGTGNAQRPHPWRAYPK